MKVLYVNACIDPVTGEICKRGVHRGLAASGIPIDLISMDIFYGAKRAPWEMAKIAREHNVDTVVLSGSDKNTTDRGDPWVREYLQGLKQLLGLTGAEEDWMGPNFPVLGICFGHQALACILGGETSRFTVRTGVVEIRALNLGLAHPALREIFKTRGSNILRAIVTHGDHVIRIPDSFYPIFTSDYCDVQGMAHVKWPILSLQSHPEMSAEIKDAPEEQAYWQHVSLADLGDHQGVEILAAFATWAHGKIPR